MNLDSEKVNLCLKMYFLTDYPERQTLSARNGLTVFLLQLMNLRLADYCCGSGSILDFVLSSAASLQLTEPSYQSCFSEVKIILQNFMVLLGLEEN